MNSSGHGLVSSQTKTERATRGTKTEHSTRKLVVFLWDFLVDILNPYQPIKYIEYFLIEVVKISVGIF